MHALPAIRLLGVELHSVRAQAAVDAIDDCLRRGEGGWVLTPNLDILRRLVRDSGFSELCRGVTLRLADGMPLVWASRLAGTPLPERVAGSDLIWSLSERAARSGWTVFLLGGDPGTADRAAAELARRYPGLRIVGTACPPFGFERDASYMSGLEVRLRAASPDIVYVALGSPKQERLIERLREGMPAAWFLGIGISFSFVCGEVRRAPAWMRRTGLEWLHRLVQEPRRLARRYLVDGIPFALDLLLRSAWAGRVARTAPTPAIDATPAPEPRYRKAG